jgi:hypothetical protein
VRRGGDARKFDGNVVSLLEQLTEEMKSHTFGQYSSNGIRAMRDLERGLDEATCAARIHKDFEDRWGSLGTRLSMVSGKELLTRLNAILQSEYSISLSTNAIVSAISAQEISEDMKALLFGLDEFSR